VSPTLTIPMHYTATPSIRSPSQDARADPAKCRTGALPPRWTSWPRGPGLPRPAPRSSGPGSGTRDRRPEGRRRPRRIPATTRGAREQGTTSSEAKLAQPPEP